ncbi:MAG: DUF423 domain-containing protein [Reichenbachiella sp.]
MEKVFFITASFLGALAVTIGAFGAHGLRKLLSENNTLSVFQTGVHYHFYHTFLLIAIAFLIKFYPHTLLNYAGYATIAGIILFSGSLYILAITNVKIWGAVTPVGGLALIIGWILVGVSLYLKA